MSSSEQLRHSQYLRSIHYIEALCRAAFDDVGLHGWEHVERVRALCKKIGSAEGADLESLFLRQNTIK
ncbi:MAG: hypothetical protein ACUVQ5_01475 [Candidatus Methanomethylicaceae archaeon]